MLNYIHRLLQDYWDHVHPQLDEDDDNDPTMRVNAIAGLADSDTVLKAVRRAALTDSRGFGKLSLRHIEVANGLISTPDDMDDPPDAAQVSAAFQDTDAETRKEILDAVSRSVELTDSIATTFEDKVGAGYGPDLSPLSDALKKIQAAVAPYAEGGGDVAADGAEGADGGAVAMGGGAAAGPGPSGGAIGGINNPNDVKNAIDRICDYYARVEPSSPVPLLLKRARRLVSADFLTIMKDIATDGVGQVNTLGGIVEEEEY